jgi:hypothetical protein
LNKIEIEMEYGVRIKPLKKTDVAVNVVGAQKW